MVIISVWRFLRESFSRHLEHLHHLIAEVVDHLDRDAAGGGFGEGPGDVAVEARPGLFVDLGLEGGLERLVGVVGAEKIGLANEKALLVIVGVDEPAGVALGAAGRTPPAGLYFFLVIQEVIPL